MRMPLIICALVPLLAPPQAAEARQARLDARLSQPVVLAGQKTKVFLKVGLTGHALEQSSDRAPVNVAIVLDKSGSMAGDKIDQAKRAARMAVDQLSPEDIVSVVAYDSTVRVLVPATRAVDRAMIHAGIDRLHASGNTALFAGVAKGADELRKFFDRNRVNRVVLLSDGLANVGPSSTQALEGLGGALAREGISVTTLGLGLDYNEDLMARLARASDGNHAFVERAADLGRFFSLEFGTVLTVVAQDVTLTIDCAPGVRPIRLLGRDGDIIGQQVIARMNQLSSGQEKFLMLEVELPAGEIGDQRNVARVSASYGNLVTQINDTLLAEVRAAYTGSPAEVERRTDREVMVRAVELVANEQSRLAVLLNDQGRRDEAEQLLQKNAFWLEDNFQRYKAPSLRKLKDDNLEDARNLDPNDYRRQRKVMRKRQMEFDMQQMY
ncbi:MAG: VWA domain-containing protein [Myxococcales bacterium]|nr:VWA domain-containing protein [Myxococcales bacterium]